jgi:hypothetical protein
MNFPLMNPAQPAYGGGPMDAFVANLTAAGSALVYSTYLGGSGLDLSGNFNVGGIAVDREGSAYVTGLTDSTNFPLVRPVQATYGGGLFDAYVAKLNAAGMIVYSTYLGGSGDDEGSDIAVDASGNAYVTGLNGSTDFPTANAVQPANGGGMDAFITKIAP